MPGSHERGTPVDPSGSSIARQIAAALLLLGIVAVALTTTALIWYQDKKEISRMETVVENIGRTLQPSLSSSMWRYLDREIEIELEGILNTVGVKHALIVSQSGQRWSAGNPVSGDAITREFPLIFSERGRSETLGALTITADKMSIRRQVYSDGIAISVFFAAWTFILAGAAFLIFRQKVTRHLDALAAYTTSMSLEPNAPPLTLKRSPKRGSATDELGMVSDAINTMRTQLSDSILEISNSEEQFRGIFEASNIGMSITNREGQFLKINRSYCNMVGYTEAELLNMTVFDLMFPEDRDTTTRNRGRSFDEGIQIRPVERRYRTSKGNTIWIRVTYTVITSTDKRPPFSVGQIEDITDRIQQEEQLRQAQKMEAVGQLTGGIAHDFNNVMTTILGSAELLERSAEQNAKSAQFGEAIFRAVERGASLTQRLLAFSRQQALSPTTIKLPVLVDGLTDLLQRTLGETIEICVEHSPDPWTALVDIDQLENAIINLVINARDAMPEGGVLDVETANITLDAAYEAIHVDVAPGDYAVLSVSDSGVGIPDEELGKAFDPFFTTKEVGKGSGLGLSMAFGFVKQSNGHITIYSEVGEGTTVRIYLPRADGAQPVSAPQEQLEVVRGGSERILVVEDDDDVRTVPVEVLKKHGYDIYEAVDGSSALAAIKKYGPFDLLFTDVVLPGGMNGVGIWDEARKTQPKMKVLFTSGYTKNAIVHNGVLDPGRELLGKPYRVDALLMKVREVLDR